MIWNCRQTTFEEAWKLKKQAAAARAAGRPAAPPPVPTARLRKCCNCPIQSPTAYISVSHVDEN